MGNEIMRLDSEKWQDAMHATVDNNTWELCELPSGRRVIGIQWIYKIKAGVVNKVERYKCVDQFATASIAQRILKNR